MANFPIFWLHSSYTVINHPPSQVPVTLYHYVAPCLCWLFHGLTFHSLALNHLYNSVVSLAVAVNTMAKSRAPGTEVSGASANKTFERTLKTLDSERSKPAYFSRHPYVGS